MSATTYSSLVSLMNVITRYQHPTCPVSFDQALLQTLLHKVSSLVDFLEKYDHTQQTRISSSQVMKNLETRMTDLIEYYYVNHVLAREGYLVPCPDHFVLCSDLEKSITEMDLIIIRVNEATVHDHLQEDTGGLLNTTDQRRWNAIVNVDSSAAAGSSAPPKGKNFKVELDDQFFLLKERLITHRPSLQIIPVVGMGGIGKTTLVGKVYNDPHVVKRFDILEWATISQQYDVKDIILSLLHRGSSTADNVDVEHLGGQLYKRLYGRRYLIIIDDIWSREAWDQIRRFLPDNANRSRILLTTRISSVARGVGSGTSYEMKFLDEDKSWDLLSETIFGQEVCPLELKEVGKKIAKSCRGLPLSIVVIGGFLKKSEKTRECWDDVFGNMSSIIHKENDGHSLEILSWSYKHLPIQLKSCFLYVATFKEDSDIQVLDLIRLWVAEGFLKPTRANSLEDVALEHLNELIDRNLVMGTKKYSTYPWKWKTQFCIIHDSLREFCLSVAENEKLFCIINNDTVNQMGRLETERRFVHPHSRYADDEPCPCLPSLRNARSLVFYWNIAPELTSSNRLLRVLHCGRGIKWDIDITPVNLRHLVLEKVQHKLQRWFSSISLAWNLETLVCRDGDVGKKSMVLSIIWDLPNLKHIVFEGDTKVTLPNPRADQMHNVLNNLQTLSGIQDFNCTDEVVKMIPNIKELGIYYSELSCCVSNMARLHKLEKLYICCGKYRVGLTKEPENLIFSPNLRQLSLERTRIPWEYMTTAAGSLPNLELLILEYDAAVGGEWNTVDGNFQRLKHLEIMLCGLKTWRAEGSHFPRLERLCLFGLDLEEIPGGIGEVASLESISLSTDKIGAVVSAREIVDQREENDDDDLIVDVIYYGISEEEAKELANDKLRVRFNSNPEQQDKRKDNGQTSSSSLVRKNPEEQKFNYGQTSSLGKRPYIDDRIVADDSMGYNILEDEFRLTKICSIPNDDNDNVYCLDLSPDGKLLANGHLSGMVSLCCPFTLGNKMLIVKHSECIREVRFSPITGFLATLSVDCTLKIWDVNCPGRPLRTFGNSNVVSMDFYPNNKDLICRGYRDGQIKYWSINTGRCERSVRVTGKLCRLRFQPRVGRYLAVACDNLVSILDAETLTCIHSLKGHDTLVLCVFWNTSGDLLGLIAHLVPHLKVPCIFGPLHLIYGPHFQIRIRFFAFLVLYAYLALTWNELDL